MHPWDRRVVARVQDHHWGWGVRGLPAGSGQVSEQAADLGEGDLGVVLAGAHAAGLDRVGPRRAAGFAIYSVWDERYREAALLSGLTAGSPQDALDTACTVHLASTDQ
ncbi:hypothetical protein [Frankia sp. CiP3]|uniref:hypothetical protein n=1 Tax=Frankia sp. CiP3 TaxID=2880971 RepID=UPI001EF711A5|nr:hypothetical protein [Frankia sp. CiP3]